MSDWLGNLRMKDEGNYTHKGDKGIRSKTDSSMREYLIGDVRGMDTLDLMKNARIAAEKVVNTLAPRPTSVQVGKDQSYHAPLNGRDEITLATNYFDDKTLNKEEKVDIMLGLAAHEAAHAAYTDETLVEDNIAKEDQRLQQLKHNIWNIIEDERIEYHLGEDRPGLVDCIAATKGYYFDKLVEKMKTNGKMPTEPLPKLLAAITQAIRYPSQMNRDDVVENFDDLDEIRRALTPYPLSPEECWEATERVMGVVRKHAEDELKDKQQQSQGNNQGSGGDGSQQQESSQDNQQGQEPAAPTPDQINQAIADALGTQQGQQVMSAIEQDTDKSSGNKQSAKLRDSEAEEFVNNDDSERMSSKGAGGGRPDTFVRKPKGNQQGYLNDMKAVKAYIPAMAKALSCKSQQSDYVLRSQPRGKLDTNKLVGYMLGSDKIFTKSGSVTCSSASVCMLIDESGSMGGELKLAARKAAILVNEAIKRIRNVNFFCYGYTSDLINVYSEGGKTSPWALSETDNISGTPTGLAMEMCASRVRRFTKDPVLMLVLTDGCPDNSMKVIEQDIELRKKGFIPIGVGILTNAVKNIFKENIIMTDIASFPVEMGKLTRGRLSKMLVRTDSQA